MKIDSRFVNLGAIGTSILFDTDISYDIGSSSQKAQAIYGRDIHATSIFNDNGDETIFLGVPGAVEILSGGQINFRNALNTLYTAFRAGSIVTATVYNLPPSDGTVGQFLETDGVGNLSWATASGISYPLLAPDGSIGAPSYSFSNSPTTGLRIDGGSNLWVQSTGQVNLSTLNNQVNILGTTNTGATAAVRFHDEDLTNWCGIRAPLTIASNYFLNLPNAQGAAGTVMVNDGAGNLSWAGIFSYTSTASAGSSASEVLPVTGLLATDTILAVSQKTVGTAALPILSWTTQADDALTVHWSADPGTGAVIVVLVKR